MKRIVCLTLMILCFAGSFAILPVSALSIIDPTQVMLDEQEMTPSEHVVPLFGCNMRIGNFYPDYQDYQMGTSSLSYTLGTFTNDKGEEMTQDGWIMELNPMLFTGKECVDAAQMDTLEFWLYVSDREALVAADFMDGEFELTSSGGPEMEETHWKLDDILAQCTQDGWNEIRLRFSDGEHYESPLGTSSGGVTDWSRVNYVRFYFINAQNLPKEPVIIKIDYIRLTDDYAQQLALYAPQADAIAREILSPFDDMPKWNESDPESLYECYLAHSATWEEAVTAGRALYEEQNEFVQALLAESGVDRRLNERNGWLINYQKYTQVRENVLKTQNGATSDDEKAEEDLGIAPPDDETRKEPGNRWVVIVIAGAVAGVLLAVGGVLLYRERQRKKRL